MNNARWKRAKALFEMAQHLDSDAADALLERRCGDDRELLRRVKAMLRAHQETGFLEQPALGSDFNINRKGGQFASGEDDSPPDPMIGRTVDRYRIVDRIGDGGMGAVYVAERADDTYTKQVALKIIKRGMDTETIVRRFEAERQILANLDHPDIARLIDGGTTDDGRPYIAMEFVDGEPIDEYCDKHILSIRERTELFRKVCAAVHAAHQNLIVHRDLKPSNILITRNGNVKLLDFGIAKVLDPDKTELTRTVPNERRLTLRYASPEQVRGESITTASDVYSLGVILFELLTGAMPHMQTATDSRRDIEDAICKEDPLRPSNAVQRTDDDSDSETATEELEARAKHRGVDLKSLQRQLCGDLDTILLMALRKEPQRRYGSAEQFGDDLGRYLNGLPVIARPDTWWYRTSKFIGRNAIGTSIAATGLLLLTGLLALVLVLYADATESRSAMAAERDRAVRSEQLAEQRLHEAETKAAIAEAVNRFLNEDLLAAADTEISSGENVTVHEVLDSAAMTVETAFQDQPEIEAAVRLTIGTAYRSLGQYDRALSHLTEAIRLRETALGEQHADTWLARKAHALLVRDMGQYREAEQLFQDVIEALDRRLGPEDHRTLDTRNHLAGLWLRQGRIDDAVTLHERVLEDCLDALGRRHRVTIEAMHNLGVAYQEQGDYDRAESMFMEALTLMRDVFGPNHGRGLVILNALGTVYAATGRLRETEALFEEVARKQKDRLGERHPSTLVAMSNHGTILMRLGEMEQAESILRRTIELRSEVLGEDHPNTLRTKNSLAVLYFNQGQLDMAAPLFEEVYELRLEQLGPEHPNTLNSLNSLAATYRNLERYDEAERMFTMLLETQRNTLGERDRTTLNTMYNMGQLYQRMDRYEESLDIMTQVYQTAQEILPDDHWDLGTYLSGIARSLKGLERFDESLEHYQQAFSIYLDTFGESHFRTRRVISELADVCERLDLLDEAMQWQAMLDDGDDA